MLVEDEAELVLPPLPPLPLPVVLLSSTAVPGTSWMTPSAETVSGSATPTNTTDSASSRPGALLIMPHSQLLTAHRLPEPMWLPRSSPAPYLSTSVVGLSCACPETSDGRAE